MKTEITVGPESSLQDILDMLPPGATVKLKPGIYRQKLQIRTPGLTLIGAGAEETRLVYDDYARKLHPDGREYNTFRTWTVAVCADGVSMRDLTVENDALSPREKGQEVALSVYGDDFLMEDCLLRSTQDTLFVGPLPQDLIRRYVDLLPPELRADRPSVRAAWSKLTFLMHLERARCTPEALFPRGGGPGLQGLQRLRHRGVYIVQTDS